MSAKNEPTTTGFSLIALPDTEIGFWPVCNVSLSPGVPTYLQTAPPRDESFTYTDTLGTVQGFLGGNKQPCAPKTINRSKSVACETDTKTVQTASDAYVNGHAVYPNGSGPSNTGGTAATQDGQPVDIAALVPLYIHLLPSNEYFAYVNTSGAVAGYVNGHKKPC